MTAVALVFTVRPWLKRRFTRCDAADGAEANLGRSAYVLDRVTTSNGRVKLAGETWSARTTGDSIEPGEEVIVDRSRAQPSSSSRARILGELTATGSCFATNAFCGRRPQPNPRDRSGSAFTRTDRE